MNYLRKTNYKKIATTLFILLFSLILWSLFIEPNLLIVKELYIRDHILAGIKIVFMSDLHLCINDINRLNKIINTVNNLHADLILLGGDYVVASIFNNTTMPPQDIANKLKQLKSKHGIFMIMGNHEKKTKATKIFTKILDSSNIKILRNAKKETKIGNKVITIVGLDWLSMKKTKIDSVFKDISTPTIVITHSPDLFPAIPSIVNFVFAGHTHGGQIFAPFGLLTNFSEHFSSNYVKGFYQENGKKMYITCGLGNSRINARLGNIPEIILARFE